MIELGQRKSDQVSLGFRVTGGSRVKTTRNPRHGTRDLSGANTSSSLSA